MRRGIHEWEKHATTRRLFRQQLPRLLVLIRGVQNLRIWNLLALAPRYVLPTLWPLFHLFFPRLGMEDRSGSPRGVGLICLIALQIYQIERHEAALRRRSRLHSGLWILRSPDFLFPQGQSSYYLSSLLLVFYMYSETLSTNF